MVLDFEALHSAVFGAMHISRNSDGSACIRRTSDIQRSFYTEADTGFFSSQHATNVTLDFFTDADSLSLSFSGRCREKRSSIRTDLLENGVPVHSHVFERPVSNSKAIVDYGNISVTFPLSPGEKRITVYFCYAITLDSLTVSLPDGATFRPYRHRYRMVTFGDSITFGTNAVFPSMTYVSQLSRLLDAQVHNFGVGGERFRSDKVLPGTYPKCDLVTVAYGTNDYGHQVSTPEIFCREMPAFLKKISEAFPDTPVFVQLPLWRSGEDQPRNLGTLDQVRQAIRQEAEKYSHFHVIDCRGFVPHLPEFFADGLHPNDLGMTHYANALYQAIMEEFV